MNISLVGYGKMGHLIKTKAEERGHKVTATIDPFSQDCSVKIKEQDKEALLRAVKNSKADSIIDFSSPKVVVDNIKTLLPLGIPLVVGTTGWSAYYEEIDKLARQVGGVIMTAGNFSVGVNLFYKIVEEAARLIGQVSEYDVSVLELHHNQKVDSPSGTALEIASRILKNSKVKKNIVTDKFSRRPKEDELHVASVRCGSIPGTHQVIFDSSFDTIELTHRARSREGFALGAVTAAEKLTTYINAGRLSRGKLYFMEDLL